MKFRADVYNEIFHSDDTNEPAAQIVKPQKQTAEVEEKQPTQDCTPEPLEEPREKETVVTEEDAPQEED